MNVRLRTHLEERDSRGQSRCLLQSAVSESERGLVCCRVDGVSSNHLSVMLLRQPRTYDICVTMFTFSYANDHHHVLYLSCALS